MSYAADALQGLGLYEKDVNEDVVSWWFPSFDASLDSVIRCRSGLVDLSLGSANTSPAVTPPTSPTSSGLSSSSFYFPSTASSSSSPAPSFRCSRYGAAGGLWHYLLTMPVESSLPALNRVRVVTIAVLAVSYDVVKARAFLTSLSKLYLDSGTPVTLLQSYLSSVTAARSLDEQQLLAEQQKAALAPVRGLLRSLGVESVLVWVAVLCKRRVLVHGGDVESVQEAVRCAGLLGSWHRRSFDFLRPLVLLREEELADLKAAGVYVAGTVDPQASLRRDLYDLAIDLSSASVIINDSARGDFLMAKFHKSTAEQLVAAAELPTDAAAVEAVHSLTSALLDTIRTLQTDTQHGPAITLQGLQQHKLPTNMDKFVVNVAKAEGMFAVE